MTADYASGTAITKTGGVHAPSAADTKLIAEADSCIAETNALGIRVELEKLESLRFLLLGSRPEDTPSYPGTETNYVPIIMEGKLTEAIRKKMMTIIEKL